MNYKLVNLILATALCAVAICAPAQSFLDVADASLDAIREGREQNAAPTEVRAIFAKAKNAADDDDKLNLCGFYTGMSKADATTLENYYKLKPGEFETEGDPVYEIKLSLKGLRRVTKGGNTFDELAQAVANRIGDLRHDYENDTWKIKTIDGIVVTISENGGFSMMEPSLGIVAGMVRIPGRTFLMGKTEVTQAQWEVVMGDNPSYFKNPDCPVERVSWDDCQTFLRKLNASSSVVASGLRFRLPSEEEWELACRAGSDGEYSRNERGVNISEGLLKYVAWFSDNSGDKTHPVGQKEANAWGLYDMHGNVEEWTSTAKGECRVFRGGSFLDSAWALKSSYSNSRAPSAQWRYQGFRLCADIR